MYFLHNLAQDLCLFAKASPRAHFRRTRLYTVLYTVLYAVLYTVLYTVMCAVLYTVIHIQYCIQYCKQYRTSAISCFCVAMLAGEFGNRKSPIFCFCPKGKGILVSRARCCSHAVSARNPRPSKQKQKIGDFLFLSLLANKSPRKQEIADVLYCIQYCMQYCIQHCKQYCK